MRTGLLPACFAAALLAGATGCSVDGLVQLPDGGDAGAPDSVAAAVLAIAGPDLSVLEGSLVQLDAHASRSLIDEAASLSWSQVDGPQVLLTNPAGPAPAFIAPLGPTSLTFRLRVKAGEETGMDDVTVRVTEQPGGLPVYAGVPPDATGVPGREVTFALSQHGDIGANVTWSARALCDGPAAVSIEGTQVTATLPETLPCAIRIDGVTGDGRRAGPAVRVYWPEGTSRPSATTLIAQDGLGYAPGDPVDVGFDLPPALSEELRLWDATGGAMATAGAEEDNLLFSAPAQRIRLLIAGERRRGAVSGGVDYLVVDVNEGLNNRAPTIASGPDRVTVPGGLFTLAPTATDLDGDEVTITITQVLGPPAIADEVTPGLYQAPDTEGILLFHVRAFDGTVSSVPATVRVTVDEQTTNQPPALTLETPRYVAPGQPFVLDARTAVDDSGYIERWTLAQDDEDPVIIVPEPIEVTEREDAAFEVIAGADGDIYHLRVTAFDAAGASTSASVEVIVEQAGPWVDPVRGDDETGNGTVGAPFASLGGALPVALRHRLAELQLTSDEHLPFGGDLPAGLSLRGGYQWDGIAYIGGGPPPMLPIIEGGLRLLGGGLANLHIQLTSPGGALETFGACGDSDNLPCALTDVVLTATAVHDGPLLVIREGASVTVTDSNITAGASEADEASAVEIRTGALARLEDTSVLGGSGLLRRAVSCDGASLDLIRGEFHGAAAAEIGEGVFSDGCDLLISGALVTGGTVSVEGWALLAEASSVRAEADAELVGVWAGGAPLGVGVRLGAGEGPVEVLGSVRAAAEGLSPTTGIGAIIATERAEFDGLTITVAATTLATGVVIEAAEAQLRDAAISVSCPSGTAVGIELTVSDGASVSGGTLSIDGAIARGVALTDQPVDGLTLADLFASVVAADDATGMALGASTQVHLDGSVFEVSAGADQFVTRGMTLGSGTLTDAVIRVVGPGTVLGVVIAQSATGAVIERSTISANSTAADSTALRAAAPAELSSTLLRSIGVTDAVALEARAASLLRHVTAVSNVTGIDLASASASLDIANSLLVAPEGIVASQGASQLTSAAACAFDADVAFDDGVSPVVDDDGLAALPCPACVFTDTTAALDENARLLPGADDLIDRGIAAFADELDIDGDARPEGLAPDIGCDEFVAPN